MIKFWYSILKILRILYSKVFKNEILRNKLAVEDDPDIVSQVIKQKLLSDKPVMIARFGAFELSTVVNYLGIQNEKKSVWNYIKGEQLQWWWNKKLLFHMENNAGFFPSTVQNVENYCKLMLSDMREVDILGSWLSSENYVSKYLNDPKLVARGKIDPFWATIPWTTALVNKKVLVIHPFSESIKRQYKNREMLFDNKNLLPDFDLIVLKAVQSMGGNANYKDWFEALDSMKNEMSMVEYDICLIGAGAYGFSLAAHAKRCGKKAVHVGGSLQLLFGITGKRWENEKKIGRTDYLSLVNDYWIRPSDSEKTSNAKSVEGGAYW